MRLCDETSGDIESMKAKTPTEERNSKRTARASRSMSRSKPAQLCRSWGEALTDETNRSEDKGGYV
jgi:hypothetical protein